MSALKLYPVKKICEKGELNAEDIGTLREWLKMQPHLPEEYITDLELALAYHSCDRSMQMTKQVLDLHYTMRTHASFFQQLEFDDKLEQSMRCGMLILLPTPTADGCRYIYAHLLNNDPKAFGTPEAARIMAISMDVWQFEEGIWPGLILVLNMNGLSMGHIARVDLSTVQQMMYYIQEALLVKLKGIHFINAPSFIDKLMMMLKPFMKQTLFSLVKIHTDNKIDGAPDFVDLDIDALRDEAIEKIKSNKEFLKEQRKKIVDESKRPGRPKTISDIFGVEGSFRKLEID